MKKIIFNFKSMPNQRIRKRTQCVIGCNNGEFELHKLKIFTCCENLMAITKGEISFDGKIYTFKWYSNGETTKKLQQYTIDELPIDGNFPTDSEITERIDVLTDEWNIQWETEDLTFE